jgi:hypothetical protein
MGLLDTPKDEALLTLGLGLLNSKGSFGNALGQAGMQSMQVFNQAKDRERVAKMQALQEEMARMNLENARRQQEQQARMEQFRASLQSPQEQNIGQAMAGGGGPTMANAQRLQPVDPNQSLMFGAMKAGLVDPVQYIQSQQKDNTPLSVAAGTTLLDRKTMKPVFTNPKEDSAPSAVREYLYAKEKDGYKGTFEQWKALQKPAGVNINYGTGSTPMQLPDGSIVMVQLSGTPGAPPQIVRAPDGAPMRPPPQNRDTKLPAELQRMQIAGDTLSTLLDQYEGMLKQHNPRDPAVQANPTVRADMQSLKRNMELQFKELQALGALAGPDIEIMRQSLADPFSVSGAYFGRDGLLAQVRRARDLVKTRASAVTRSQGKPDQEPQPDADPLGLRK